MMRTALASGTLPLLLMVDAERAAAQIQDNSFLVEEAYNQEPGVVQHIATFDALVDPDSGPWAFSFTQEWPAASQTHQWSYTIPIEHDEETGLGDILLNYRWQAVGSGETKVAVSPRVSLSFPTGDEHEGFGRGELGVQVNLPISVALGDAFVTHWNAGGTVGPEWGRAVDASATTKDVALGASLIWLAAPKLNPMFEVVWLREESVVGDDETESASALVINPGIRGAIDLECGLQIVPGVSVPIVFPDEERETSVFGYLSLEHPFRHAN